MKSVTVAVVIIILVITNISFSEDAIIWRQELSCDSNSECGLGALIADGKDNQIIILGTSMQSDIRETDLRMWKIDPNGIVTQKKSLGSSSKYNSLMSRPFGIKAIVKPDTGDVVRLNMYDDANNISLSITSRNMLSRSTKIDIRRKPSEVILLHDMMSYQGDNLLYVGQEGLNGIVMKTDLSGNVLWKKIFHRGQTNILSSVAYSLGGNDFYVVGLSVSMAGKITFAGPATICVLRYDDKGEIKESDFFEGGMAPWPSSIPRIICFSSGIVLVVYDKSKNGKATDLYAKAYTEELNPLWEKQILQTKEEGPPAHFDICAIPENRFAFAGKVNYRDLRIYEYKEDGTILQTVELDGEAGSGGIYVDYLAGKIFVAFSKQPKENEKEAKIELLAIKSSNSN